MSHVVIEPPCRVVVVDARQIKERVLVVGDVHGCLEELKALLDKANYLDGRTTVVLAGDVCNKGPLSAETVAFCRESNFLCVRGNHDHAALKAYHRMAPKYSHLLPEQWAWVTKLSQHDVDWLQRLPYVLVCPFGVVVHAGLQPSIPSLYDQDPGAMMHMRSVRLNDGRWLEGGAGGEEEEEVAAWAGMWSGPQRVFFGHDAKRRLQRCKWALGLDTACVYGFQLTAAEVAGGSGAELAFDHPGAEVKLIAVNAAAEYAKPSS